MEKFCYVNHSPPFKEQINTDRDTIHYDNQQHEDRNCMLFTLLNVYPENGKNLINTCDKWIDAIR